MKRKASDDENDASVKRQKTEEEGKSKREELGDSLEYLRQMEEIAGDQKFEDEEDKTTFLENVLEEVEGKEVDFFFNGMAAYSIESIVQFAQENQIRQLMQKLNGNWVNLCTNKGSSHPIQIMLGRVAESLSQEYHETGKPIEEGDIPTLQQEFEIICEEFTGNIFRFVRSPYGSFVFRDVLSILSGVRKLQKKHGSKNQRSHVKRTWKMSRVKGKVPDLFVDYLVLWMNEICEMEEFEKLTYSQESVPVLSALLECLHAVGKQNDCDALAIKIMSWKRPEVDEEEIEEEKPDGDEAGKKADPFSEYDPDENSLNFVHDLLIDQSASHLMEKICYFISPRLVTKIYKRHLKPGLVKLSFNKCANYCVQKTLLRITSAEDISSAYDELFPKFPELIKRNLGVIWGLLEAVSKNTKFACSKIKEILDKLKNLLNIKQDENLFRKLNRLNAPDGRYSQMGCLIFISLLKFFTKDIQGIYRGLTKFAESNLHELTCNPILSRVFDQACKALVKGRSRQQLVKKVLMDMDNIVIDKHGSFSIEIAFWAAQMKVKKRFAQQFEERYNKFSGNKFAVRAMENFDMDFYRELSKKGDFSKWQEKISKRQKEEKWKNRHDTKSSDD